MMGKINSKRQEGFTIIEVLIVLAIAGLIMLIVFLAVPTLQRNSRNNARQSDAALIVSAVNECLANRNGVVASCSAVGGTGVVFDTAKFSQLIGSATFGAGTGTTTAATWVFGTICTADGTATAGGTPRQFAVRWLAEGATGTQQRCIDS